MSKGIKKIINVDKFKVCYIAKNEILTSIENENRINFNGFYIEKIPRNEIGNYYNIIIYNDKEENGKYILGEMQIGNKFEKDNLENRYCWISVNNENLYPNNFRLNFLYCLQGIQENIGLYFNNITNLDIAVDSNYNFFKKVWNEIRNKETLNVILNKKYPNTKETLKGIFGEFPLNSEKFLNGGFRISNKEKDMKLRIYDKTQEILDSSDKTYIQDRFFSIKKIFRSEVALKNKSIEEYCLINKLKQYDLYMRINDEELLWDIYRFYSDRLIHFIDSNRNKKSILDL